MNTVFILNNHIMGKGNDELGIVLMGAFLKKIWARKDKPSALILYNSAVTLLGSDSPYLDAMTGLEESGVEILACGTCLDAYGLTGKIKAGRQSNMEEIVDLMMKAEKTVTI